MSVLPLNRPGWPLPPDVSRRIQEDAEDAVKRRRTSVLTRLGQSARLAFSGLAGDRWVLGRYLEPRLARRVQAWSIVTGLELAVCAALGELDENGDVGLLAELVRQQRRPSLWDAAYHLRELGSPGIEFADEFAVKLAIWRVRLR